MDAVTRHQLAARWAYRASLEHVAAARFRRLAERLEAAELDRELVAIAALAEEQEREHVRLCSEIAARFGVAPVLGEPVVGEVAPIDWELRDRVVYEVVAFCCVTETANASIVTAGADDIDDTQIRRALRTILADEIQHSRLGWRFLATHAPTDEQRAWLGGYLPAMLRATLRVGVEPQPDRHAVLVTAMRDVVLPGLAQYGIDVGPAAAVLDDLEGVSVRRT